MRRLTLLGWGVLLLCAAPIAIAIGLLSGKLGSL